MVGPGIYYEWRGGEPVGVPTGTPVPSVDYPSGGGVQVVYRSYTPELHEIYASTFLSVVDVSVRPVVLGRTAGEVGREGE